MFMYVLIDLLGALHHTGLISSDSIQITTLTVSLKIQPFWLKKVILSLLYMSNDIWLQFENNEKTPSGGSVIQKNQKQIL